MRHGALELRGISIDELPTRIRRPDGVEAPKLLTPVHPQYTADAMRRKVEGAVRLEALVLPDGSVGGASVIQTLDRDLDRQAADALGRWRFAPVLVDGRPGSVIVTVELTFTMRTEVERFFGAGIVGPR